MANVGQFDCDIAIVGAGPYGLSAAAYLLASGFRVQVFGEPMAFWATTMPEGMLLRSPRVASTMADPAGKLTLEAYEAAAGVTPAAPLPLSTFVDYGLWFQKNLGSIVDRTPVRRIDGETSSFKVTLADGRSLNSRRVVVAAGIGPFRSKPSVFDALPPTKVSHCYEGRNMSEFAGKRVDVISAGQSALESA